MPTTPGGRFSPGDSDDWDLTTDLAAMQVSNESASAAELAPFRRRGATVNSAAARNALFPSPVQGDRVFRSDLGYDETYFQVYNSGSNPGGSRFAGWFPPNRIFQAVRSGQQALAAGSWTIINQAISEARNDGLGVLGNGAFTVTAAGTYRVSGSVYTTAGSNPCSVQITKNSTTADTANTIAGGIVENAASRGGFTVSNVVTLAAGDVVRLLVFSSVANFVNTAPGLAGATFNIEKL